MSRPRLELADIFRRYGGDFRSRCGDSLTSLQRKVMAAVEQCRSAALGGFVEQCGECGQRRVCYRSCRNRHCPKCQGPARDEWLAQRRCELLDCEYFHVVFTLPAALAALALQNRRLLYGLLFRAAARTLREIAADPKHLGAAIGFLAVLHTWGSNLAYHPHLHCVVPGGGLSPERDRWIACRPGFFLPVRVLSRRFRTLFLEGLEREFNHGRLRLGGALEPLADPHAFARFLRPLRRCQWVVYAKAPFDGPARVLDYLGRYTHRVAISNERILAIDDGTVRFRWKDYRQQHRWKTMALPAAEFIRRFLLHTLPPRFHRIRHFGLFAGPCRQQQLALCQRLLGMPPATPDSEPPADYRDRFEALTGRSLRICPACGRGTMETVETVPPGSQPPPLDDTS